MTHLTILDSSISPHFVLIYFLFAMKDSALRSGRQNLFSKQEAPREKVQQSGSERMSTVALVITLNTGRLIS